MDQPALPVSGTGGRKFGWRRFLRLIGRRFGSIDRGGGPKQFDRGNDDDDLDDSLEEPLRGAFHEQHAQECADQDQREHRENGIQSGCRDTSLFMLIGICLSALSSA